MTDDLAARLEDLMAHYGIAELDIEEGDLRLCLRHRSSHAPASDGTTAGPVEATSVIRATSFGTLHLSHPASSAAPPVLPRKVRRGEIIAYAAIGPLLRPILAARDAVLVTLLLSDGAEIGFGDPLFETDEDSAPTSS